MRSDQRNGSSGVDGVKATFHFTGAPSGFSRLDEETPGVLAAALGGLARGWGANLCVPQAHQCTQQAPQPIACGAISEHPLLEGCYDIPRHSSYAVTHALSLLRPHQTLPLPLGLVSRFSTPAPLHFPGSQYHPLLPLPPTRFVDLLCLAFVHT